MEARDTTTDIILVLFSFRFFCFLVTGSGCSPSSASATDFSDVKNRSKMEEIDSFPSFSSIWTCVSGQSFTIKHLEERSLNG